jgi:hypothetical protein
MFLFILDSDLFVYLFIPTAVNIVLFQRKKGFKMPITLVVTDVQ